MGLHQRRRAVVARVEVASTQDEPTDAQDASEPNPAQADERLSTAYDIEAHPYADVFDPIAWYQTTGEDLGLPPGYLERAERAEAEMRAWLAAQKAAAEKTDASDGTADETPSKP